MIKKNFCIIAHIDHGKSTLSDAIIEICDSNIAKNQQMTQILDSMDLERERGITIKLNFVRLNYKNYQLNLIDTPGHTDFTYEVSRSLCSCEGAVLLVDATQGIQAQTISNYLLAKKNNLKIIPVINKIDNLNADVDGVSDDLVKKFNFSKDEIIAISAKTRLNCDILIKKIIEIIPDAPNNTNAKLKALIFDVSYHKYKGAIIYVRIFEGKLKNNDKLLFFYGKNQATVIGIEIKRPMVEKINELSAGDVGAFYANIKNIKTIKIGDTVTSAENPVDVPLDSFEETTPIVFASFFPSDPNQRELFKSSLERLSLSDSSFEFSCESSVIFGFGARCGFLGLLHLDIIKERLLREFNLKVFLTKPSVKYEVYLKNKSVVYINNPSDLPDVTKIQEIKEPYLIVEIFVDNKYIGITTELLNNYRSKYIDLQSQGNNQSILKYQMPLSELIENFYDNLKSVTNGYGHMNYKFHEYKKENLVKIDILLNNEVFSQFSFICKKELAFNKSQKIIKELKKIIPAHLFEIPIQAAINKKIIARETIKAQKKNVTAKCYGGDITRKKKLWEAQKRGKKKLKETGRVIVPRNILEKLLKNL